MAQGVKLLISDKELRAAIANSQSWRGVMRYLGYATTSGYLGMRLQIRAQDLGILTEHIARRAVWTAHQLGEAVRDSTNWGEVVTRLGMSPGNRATIAKVRGEVERQGVDCSHFAGRRQPDVGTPFTAKPERRFLRSAAGSVAAAWFTRRGYSISYPSEPRPYDLVVEASGSLYRVQVKSAGTRDSKSGSIICRVGRTPLRDGQQIAYDPADVDFFFIIDIEDNYYIVPIREIAGHVYVSVSTLQHRKVEH